MKKDIEILINSKTSKVTLPTDIIGLNRENLQGKLIFKFEDEFVDGIARIEISKNREKSYIGATKVEETYVVPILNSLLTTDTIDMQLVITESEVEKSIPIFKSKVFYLKVLYSINAEIEEPEEYPQWIERANVKLNEMDNLNIDIIPEGNNLKIILTKKDGTTKEIILEGAKSYDDTEVRRLIKVNADAILKLDKDKVSISDLKDYVVDKDYVHTDNNYTNEEKNKLSSLENYDDTKIKTDISNFKNNKQDKLIAGDNITIDENNVINVIGGSSEYDDTEIKNEISKLSINKANAIVIESQLTNNSDLEFAYESDDYKNTTFIKIKSTELNYDKILLSKNVELLPDFDSISNDGSTGGLTIELIDNNSLRINGNCTSNMSVFLKLQNNNSFKINKSLTKDSNVCFGLLSKGTMTGSENYLTTVFEGSTNTSKNIYFSGNGIKQEVLPLKSDSNSMKIWLNLIAGNNYDNYIVTPFAFEGEQIEIIDNPSYVNEYYNIKLSDLSEYNYISTYPNKHKIKYNEDTKKYIDNIKPESSLDPVKPDLTYITPEDYGAKGDGATDDTKALNDCLLAAKSSGGRLYVRGLKEYRITSTIEIIGDFLDVELNRITYEGNDFAVKIVSRWANIHLKTIFANNGSGILLKDDNASTSCVSNNFYFDFINSKNDCIKFEALYEWNIAYNNFKVPHLKSVDSNLINVNNSCSECSFIGARVDCISGWCIFKSVNTNVFRDFSFEKCKNICYGYAKLENCRTTEGLNYYPWKGSEGTLIKFNKVGESTGATITDFNTPSTYTGIDVSEIPSFEESIARINEKIEEYAEDEQKYYKAFYDVIEYAPNIITNVNRYDAGQNSIEYKLNGKVIIYWNKKAYVPNNEIEVEVTESFFTPLTTILDNPTCFKISNKNCDIYLNDSYCPVGINSFKIKQLDGKKAKVYNKDGNLIFDGYEKDDGIYIISCEIIPLTLEVFKNINAPDSWKNTYINRIKNIYTGSNEVWQVVKEIDDTELKNRITNAEDDIDDLETTTNKLDERISVLEGNFPIETLTWNNIQELVQKRLVQNYFEIGDQFVTKWKDTATNKEYEVPLDIVAFRDVTIEENGEEKVVPGMILQWHYATPFGVQLSQNQAFKYAKDIILAGTYYFTIDTDWGECIKGKSYQFTLTKDIPIGGQIQIGLANSEIGACPDQKPNNWRIRTYADCNTVVPLEIVTLTEGTEGTFLGRLTSSRKYNEDELNNLQSSAYGHNRWKTSALRQFLNSDASSGAWWSNQGDVFDRIPNECANKNGFLSGVEEDLLNVIKPIKVTSAISITRDSNFGEWDYTYDKFFLPSMEEVYCEPKVYGEGEYWDYWKEKSGTSSPNAQFRTNPNMITYAVANHSSPETVRLRSSTLSNCYSSWNIYTSGYITNGRFGYSTASACFSPACVIC